MKTLERLLQDPLLEALGWALIHSLWQGLIVVVLVASLLKFVGHTHPKARYTICLGAMGVLLFATAATFVIHNAVPSELIPRTALVEKSDLAIADAYFDEGHLWRQEQRINPEHNRGWLPGVAALLWLVGVAVYYLRFLIGISRVNQLRTRGVQAAGSSLESMTLELAERAGVSSAVRVLLSNCVDVPVTVGWLKPCILVPASIATGFSTHDLEALIAHEMMHVRRRDYLVNIIQQLIEVALFFNPAVWWLSRHIRFERECCCDLGAAQLIGDTKQYATALARMEEQRAALQPLLSATGSYLPKRLRRLLGTPEQTAPPTNPIVLAFLGVMLATIVLLTSTALVADERIIPRSALFQPNTRTAVKVSPSGEWISFRGAWKGASNFWIAPRTDPQSARPLTSLTGRGIRWAFWSQKKDTALFTYDSRGEENWKLNSVNARTGEVKTLIDVPGAQASVQRMSVERPNEIVVALNDRDPHYHDLYMLDLETGQRELIFKRTGRFRSFVFDDDLRLRFAAAELPSGDFRYFQRTATADWVPFMDIDKDDAQTTWLSAFDKTGRVVYMIDSRGRDKAAIASIHLDTGEYKVLFEHPNADTLAIFRHPIKKHFIGTAVHDKKWKWYAVDPDFAEDVEYLDRVSEGTLGIHTKSDDNRWWTVSYVHGNKPQQWYLYDRSARRASFLFSRQSSFTRWQFTGAHNDGQLVCGMNVVS
ncbi:MAG: M56 family metallopeptidase, partial [Pseudomonadota bacterium]